MKLREYIPYVVLTLVIVITSFMVVNIFNANVQEAVSTNKYQPVPLVDIVVAKTEIPRGASIVESMIKVVDWPEDAQPDGGFSSIEGVIGNDKPRATTTIFPGEPIVKIKLSRNN